MAARNVATVPSAWSRPAVPPPLAVPLPLGVLLPLAVPLPLGVLLPLAVLPLAFVPSVPPAGLML